MTDGSLGRKPVDKMINKKKPPQGATQKRELDYNLHKFRVSPSARAVTLQVEGKCITKIRTQ